MLKSVRRFCGHRSSFDLSLTVTLDAFGIFPMMTSCTASAT